MFVFTELITILLIFTSCVYCWHGLNKNLIDKIKLYSHELQFNPEE